MVVDIVRSCLDVSNLPDSSHACTSSGFVVVTSTGCLSAPERSAAELLEVLAEGIRDPHRNPPFRGALGGPPPKTHPPTRRRLKHLKSYERLPATTLHCLAMVSRRHAPGSRTRAAGYKGKGNWCTTTKAQLDEQAALLQVRGGAHNCFVPGEHM